jgi:hypothetical protein
MGETVVKTIKEATIWLGEITVLPNEQEGLQDRLRHGVYKMTLGKIDSRSTKANDVEAGKGKSNGGSDFQELHPSLARVFRVRQRKETNQEHMATEDRLAAEFEESEKIDESIARGRGNRSEEGNIANTRLMNNQELTGYRGASLSPRSDFSDTQSVGRQHGSYP